MLEILNKWNSIVWWDLREHEVVEVCILELKFIWSICTWEFQVENLEKFKKYGKICQVFGKIFESAHLF